MKWPRDGLIQCSSAASGAVAADVAKKKEINHGCELNDSIEFLYINAYRQFVNHFEYPHLLS